MPAKAWRRRCVSLLQIMSQFLVILIVPFGSEPIEQKTRIPCRETVYLCIYNSPVSDPASQNSLSRPAFRRRSWSASPSAKSSSSSLPECHLMSFDKGATYFRSLCLNHLSHILSRNCGRPFIKRLPHRRLNWHINPFIPSAKSAERPFLLASEE